MGSPLSKHRRHGVINADLSAAHGIRAQNILRGRDAANYLQISLRTLDGWRIKGGGPRYIKLKNKIILYRLADLDEWLTSQERNHTHDTGDTDTEVLR
jgi:predicted DNA-binding transcriptional regulator AlpA